MDKYRSVDATAQRMSANKSMPFTSIRKKADDQDGMWAEVAKFNQLLDYKIRLDNAE